jgi:hypothetical protein
MQYMQQGLMEVFVESIEGHDKHSWIVGFLDQQPNQLLAQEGSLTGKLATLDLSEASDRVSNQLVIEMLDRHTLTREAVQAADRRRPMFLVMAFFAWPSSRLWVLLLPFRWKPWCFQP